MYAYFLNHHNRSTNFLRNGLEITKYNLIFFRESAFASGAPAPHIGGITKVIVAANLHLLMLQHHKLARSNCIFSLKSRVKTQKT